MTCFENGKVKDMDLPDLFKAGNNKKYICLMTLAEFVNIDIESGIKQKMVEEFHNHNNINSKIENHDDFDLIYLSIPNQLSRKDNVDSLSIYISNNLFLTVYVPWKEYDNIIETVADNLNKNTSPSANLLCLLDMFTREDSHILQGIEESINDLEDDLITSYDNGYIKDIISFRRRLLILKRYYEQLIDLFDGLGESSFLSDADLKHCGNIAGRIDRLFHTVLNMRDYVTQVREAYQSQADIALNKLMKVFTVVTTIFLPLTLITGWYGMNFKIPEYGWIYGYPAVIIICIIIVISSIVIFKKNKWF